MRARASAAWWSTERRAMNGAETLVETLLASNVNVCFANPGTSEMHFVAALDQHPDMRCILCLFEGGATGAADGYYRMTGQVAATLLHLAPGFGNGFANLHNARKAQSGRADDHGRSCHPSPAIRGSAQGRYRRHRARRLALGPHLCRCHPCRPRRGRGGARRAVEERPDRHADPARRHRLDRGG